MLNSKFIIDYHFPVLRPILPHPCHQHGSLSDGYPISLSNTTRAATSLSKFLLIFTISDISCTAINYIYTRNDTCFINCFESLAIILSLVCAGIDNLISPIITIVASN